MIFWAKVVNLGRFLYSFNMKSGRWMDFAQEGLVVVFEWLWKKFQNWEWGWLCACGSSPIRLPTPSRRETELPALFSEVTYYPCHLFHNVNQHPYYLLCRYVYATMHFVLRAYTSFNIHLYLQLYRIIPLTIRKEVLYKYSFMWVVGAHMYKN